MSNRPVSLKDYVPTYYEDVKEISAIIAAESKELHDYQSQMTELLSQFFIDEATWGLEYWEKACGIKTDKTKAMNDRRASVKTKIKGVGTMTLSEISSIANSFYRSEVKENPTKYTIAITVVGTRGAPPDLDIMKKAIGELIPAHLKLDFVLSYLTWDELSKVRWQDIEVFTWDELEVAYF